MNHLTLLVTLSGRDRPGVTAQLFTALAGTRSSVLDVEQVVIRGHLVLGVLLTTDELDVTTVVDQVRAVGTSLGMSVETELGHDEDDPRRRGRLHVSVVAEPMTPSALAAVAAELASLGANIDRIVRLSRSRSPASSSRSPAPSRPPYAVVLPPSQPPTASTSLCSRRACCAGPSDSS